MKENAGTREIRLEQMFGVKKEQSVLRMQHLNWLPTGNMLNKDEKKASKQAKQISFVRHTLSRYIDKCVIHKRA